MWKVIINGPGCFDTPFVIGHDEVLIGRGDESDIVLTGPWVSRQHARLEARGEVLYLEDLGSRNGSRLNEQPLHGTTALRPGDRIQIGEHTLLVQRAANVENLRAPLAERNPAGVRRFGRGTHSDPIVKAFRPAEPSKLLENLFELPLEADLAGATRSGSRDVSFKTLLLLAETAERVDGAEPFQSFLEEALDWVLRECRALNAVVLLQHRTGTLVPVAVRQLRTLPAANVPVSDAVVETTLEKKMAIALCAVGDDRKIGIDDTRSEVNLAQLDVLSIPIGTPDIVGVLYINRTQDNSDVLGEVLEVGQAVAQLVAGAYSRFLDQDRERHVKQLRVALNRFHAPDIVRRQGGAPRRLDEKRVTVVFADIAGFTHLTQTLLPDRISDLLNQFYDRMLTAVFSLEGTVDKFVGDSVMALFGAPFEHSDDAVRAVRCALAMKEEWAKAMNQRPLDERCQLLIGVHTGKALVGMVGAEMRVDYTAVGRTVSIASALCESAEPGQILASEVTVNAVDGRFNLKPQKNKPVNQFLEELPVFAVLDESDESMNTMPGLRERENNLRRKL